MTEVIDQQQMNQGNQDQDQTPTQVENENLKTRLSSVEERLNDPEYIAYLHTRNNPDQTDRHEEQNDADENDDPMPAFESIDTENMTSEQVVQEMERRNQLRMEWQQRQVDKRLSTQEQQRQQEDLDKRKQSQVQKIKEFVNNTSDFKDYESKVRELYGQPMTIEQAYNYAKWAKIAKEAETDQQNKPPRGTGRRPSSDQGSQNKTKMYDNVADGAKAALDEVTQAMGDIDTLG